MGIKVVENPDDYMIASFHSIRIPSEWGSLDPVPSEIRPQVMVSIQLGSPASGELHSGGTG